MAKLDRIVKINLTNLTQAISKNEFNKQIIVGNFTLIKDGEPYNKKVLGVTGADQLLDFGITAQDAIYVAVQTAFAQKPAVDVVYIGVLGEDLTASMAAIIKENNKWYGVNSIGFDVTKIIELANWCEANEKLHGVRITEDTLELAQQLKDKGYDCTYSLVANADNEYPEVAIMSRCFTIYPGGETWANKKLKMVTPAEMLESTYDTITDLKSNTYEWFNNQDFGLTQNGKVASGEWIDVIRFGHWLKAEMQTDVVYALINSNKIPYTDEGIEIICNAMLPSLRLGTERGGIARNEIDEDGNVVYGYVIKKPKSTNISSNNKALRILKDLFVRVRLAGAIHKVELDVYFAYDQE